MKPSSVRARLTLWNVAILALVLAGFGVGLCVSVNALLQRSVDAELRQMARGQANRRHAGPPPGGRFNGQGFPDERRQPGEPDPGFQNHDGFPDQPPPPPPPEGQERMPRMGGLPTQWVNGSEPGQGRPEAQPDFPRGNRQMYIRRPRFLNRSGGPFNPNDADTPWDAATVADAVAGRESFSTVTVSLEGEEEQLRVISYPLFRNDGRSVWVEGVLQIGYSLTELNRLQESLVRVLLMLIPIALLAAGAGGLFLTDRALRPVREITEAAGEIGAQDLSRRLRVAGRDEFARLAMTFNGMIARLQEAFRRQEAAYEQQRRFVGDASHELRTPLTTIKANTSLALFGERTPEEYCEMLREVDQAADVMSRIVQDLLLLARSDAGELVKEERPVALGPVLERALNAVKRPETAHLDLTLPDPSPTVLGDDHHLLRLFTNLLENATRHTPPEGKVSVEARCLNGTVLVEVRDTGEGIAPEHLPHLCERFYRVDTARSRARGGTGLGLAICRSIVEAHGGRLQIDSRLGAGTTVTVTLPRIEVERPNTPLAAAYPVGREV